MRRSVSTPRIGVIGAGAIGGFYGLMLARAGYDVHFLLRSDYAIVREQGLHIDSALHGSLDLHPAQVYRDVADMPQCDWLLVAAKSSSNAALAPLINQAAATGARVILLQNGLGVEDELRPGLDDSLHLFGGLCFICIHRGALGRIVHQSQGMLSLGYHSGPAADQASRQAMLEAGAALFRHAGLESTVLSNLEQGRWQKLVWNVPFNGLSVVLNAGTTALMGNPHSRELVQALMQEVVHAAAACGHALPDAYAERVMKSTDRMPDYLPSMYHDFSLRRPLELKAIYMTPLAAAAAAGCALPRLQMLLQTLSFLDQRNRVEAAQ
ncbi:putative 2-dehydropantoate 2-reductase [Pseudomonas sp. N040]|uniref:putative 2-dehydropantoate 2-reductase n=1 Tax=Pseudomonas sp. N040 TaxID=2785325 RepID=UPI0018A2F4B0|nr:putative 2-dehydropantoate 2-reductase [Pseudomonas sp. N040]MBF7730791.1 putative 2-dehydropantoate 2-reductase [Pseudomonas sp. N040]MBW7014434.1 putative 2-dehydropantoate 2-reductase [Pseudomonas sp. N040]